MGEEDKNVKSSKDVLSPPKNILVPFVLLCLRDFNLHGYMLMQRLMDYGFSTIEKGNFYRILRQLEKDELVQSDWDTSTSGPAKRIYSITDLGEQYLKTYAGALEQYQSMLDQFFSLYTNMFMPNFSSHTKKDDEK